MKKLFKLIGDYFMDNIWLCSFVILIALTIWFTYKYLPTESAESTKLDIIIHQQDSILKLLRR